MIWMCRLRCRGDFTDGGEHGKKGIDFAGLLVFPARHLGLGSLGDAREQIHAGEQLVNVGAAKLQLG